MSTTATKVTTTKILRGGEPSTYLPVLSKDFNPVIDDVLDLETRVVLLDAGTFAGGVSGTLGTFTAGVSQGTSNVTEFTVLTTLTAAEIVGTAAGDIGHANGATLVAAPSSSYALEFVSALFVYDFGVAAYTGGAGDLVVAIGSAGAAFTSAITAANLLTAAGDKVLTIKSIATELPLTVGTAISLRGTAYTQPGTAAGVLRVYTTYRQILTGL